MLSTPAAFAPLLAPQAAARTLAFLFRGAELLVREQDLAVPEAALLAHFGLEPAQMLAVGLGDAYCATALVPGDAQPPAGYAFSGLRRLFGAMDEALLAVAGRAFQIAEWARTHRFCGVCGTPMQRVEGERCFRCPACGHVGYPRIAPAMMVLIRRGDAILLARHARLPTSRFTALAGYVEPGESIEEAIHREVFEEVGLRVRDLRYFASQSWPFPHSLMIAFTAEYAGGELALDRSEIVEARWFGPGDEMPEIPPPQSIAAALIRAHAPRKMP
ncbi:MAG: NAD(+) diphosphatase [Burkholderiaceae bacterium]|nr:NAD(+) diphosphatase [Burkholderiaceae bacterium]